MYLLKHYTYEHGIESEPIRYYVIDAEGLEEAARKAERKFINSFLELGRITPFAVQSARKFVPTSHAHRYEWLFYYHPGTGEVIDAFDGDEERAYRAVFTLEYVNQL